MRGLRWQVQFQEVSGRYKNVGYSFDTPQRARDFAAQRKRAYPFNTYRVAVRVPAGKQVANNANNS